MRVKLNSENIKILICCHKPALLPEDPDGIFLPVFGGAALRESAAVDEQLAMWRGGGHATIC